MPDIKTKFLGLELQSPIIVSSSGLSKSIEKIKEMEKYGAGAVVLKSLFEEQINFEANTAISESKKYPEAADYIRGYSKHNSIDEYLQLIKKAKAAVNIPIIASINCVSAKDWTDFASNIEHAGADAIELNINILPVSENTEEHEILKQYYEIIETVNKKINIPIIVKIGSHFTNIIAFAKQLYIRGAQGITLFNRFYEPDININKMEMTSASVFSDETDIRHNLRWVGMTSSKIKGLEVAASTGIHSGEAVVKQLLAGAKVTQVCSILYKQGIKHIEVMNNELIEWMQKKNYNTIDEFRGKMSCSKIPNPQIYIRSQFMKYFSSME